MKEDTSVYYDPRTATVMCQFSHGQEVLDRQMPSHMSGPPCMRLVYCNEEGKQSGKCEKMNEIYPGLLLLSFNDTIITKSSSSSSNSKCIWIEMGAYTKHFV